MRSVLRLRATQTGHFVLKTLIHWRVSEIVVRGKGSQRDDLPLVADVGDAVTRYLSTRVDRLDIDAAARLLTLLR